MSCVRETSDDSDRIDSDRLRTEPIQYSDTLVSRNER